MKCVADSYVVLTRAVTILDGETSSRTTFDPLVNTHTHTLTLTLTHSHTHTHTHTHTYTCLSSHGNHVEGW
jgi:hypothetical protein